MLPTQLSAFRSAIAPRTSSRSAELESSSIRSHMPSPTRVSCRDAPRISVGKGLMSSFSEGFSLSKVPSLVVSSSLMQRHNFLLSLGWLYSSDQYGLFQDRISEK